VHQKLSIYEKEFLALIMAVDKWRPYLQRQEFIIRTDHRSLSYLTEQTLHSELQKKAMTRMMMGLQFKVVCRKGKENLAADALSRVSHLHALQAVSEVTPLWVQEVVDSYATDVVALNLLAKLAIHSPDEKGYSLENGLHKGRVWIAHNSALQTKLIAAMHASAVGGILVQKQHISDSRNSSIGKGLSLMWGILSSNVRFVNKPNMSIPTLLVSCSHYLFQMGHGRIYLWILLKGYHPLKDTIPFWS
jgi:hypothetical protein